MLLCKHVRPSYVVNFYLLTYLLNNSSRPNLRPQTPRCRCFSASCECSGHQLRRRLCRLATASVLRHESVSDVTLTSSTIVTSLMQIWTSKDGVTGVELVPGHSVDPGVDPGVDPRVDPGVELVPGHSVDPTVDPGVDPRVDLGVELEPPGSWSVEDSILDADEDGVSAVAGESDEHGVVF